jgi:transglutaminase-like putative cysteine protease
VLFWSLVVWAVAVWQSWFVRRRSQPLLAVLPSGALLAVTLNYTRQSVLPLAAFLAATLSLLSLVEFRNLIQHWEGSGTDYSEDVRFEMVLASLSLIMILTTAAALTPSISIRQLVEWTSRVRAQEAGEPGQVAESFGLKPRTWGKSPFGDFFSPGLPRSHLLGSGPELSEQVVMVVQVEGLPVSAVPGWEAPGERFYWRGLVYDSYSGRGWFTGRTEVISYPAGEVLSVQEHSTEQRVIQKVRLYSRPGPEGMQLLYATGELAAVDQETQVAWRSHQDVFGALGEQEEYQAVSLNTKASENQLRQSGQDYPQWVLNRYLALPESVPARVLGLGRDLTATGATPYDRALAIESYLRSIPYSLEVPVPPTNRDLSDYFLFDLRRGYCDYYATAMVVLARAAGLPARLVTGYAPGQFDPSSAAFTVTAADAHSWVEIYFPGYGWVEFEPTGGRSPIVRSAGDGPQTSGPAIETPETAPVARVGALWQPLIALLTALAMLLLGGYAAWLLLDGWSLKRLEPSGTVAALYRRLYRQGRTLDKEISPAHTPYEFARQLVGQITHLVQAGKFQHRLAPAVEEVERLADLYARSIYSPRPAGSEDQQTAIRTWKKLHWRLWLARLVVKKQA